MAFQLLIPVVLESQLWLGPLRTVTLLNDFASVLCFTAVDLLQTASGFPAGFPHIVLQSNSFRGAPSHFHIWGLDSLECLCTWCQTCDSHVEKLCWFDEVWSQFSVQEAQRDAESVNKSETNVLQIIYRLVHINCQTLQRFVTNVTWDLVWFYRSSLLSAASPHDVRGLWFKGTSEASSTHTLCFCLKMQFFLSQSEINHKLCFSFDVSTVKQREGCEVRVGAGVTFFTVAKVLTQITP